MVSSAERPRSGRRPLRQCGAFALSFHIRGFLPALGTHQLDSKLKARDRSMHVGHLAVTVVKDLVRQGRPIHPIYYRFRLSRINFCVNPRDTQYSRLKNSGS